MQLNQQGLNQTNIWLEKGYQIPTYDRAAMIEKTKAAPMWLHFGAGNLFKAFQANVAERLLNEGVLDRGIIAIENSDPIVLQNNRDHDTLHLLATLKADGTIEKNVIGSIAESVLFQLSAIEEYARVKEIFMAPSLQMVSFTITEKGYAIKNSDGSLKEDVLRDLERAPEKATTYLGKVCSMLYARYQAGRLPLAMVSMDNCSHNGDVLKASILAYANAWEKRGYVEEGFLEYLSDPAQVSFPWTMIDKITPRPDQSVSELFNQDGIDDLKPIINARGTYVAPFVNAEETEYLVIEDAFPNGRPSLEKGGIIFTDRKTVDLVETMKVTTCLNPLHTALAIFGCLLDHSLISQEMEDEDLVRLVKTIGYQEGLPVVNDPKILDPKEFIDTVIEVRLPNPFMPDAPQRIATDTSQKLPVRFGETIKKYIASATLDVHDLHAIPLVFAGWLRYLMQINDAGQPFVASPDPLLDELCPLMADLQLGDRIELEQVRPFLANEKIFGVDLIEAGLADDIVALLNQMNTAPGAIRQTLHDTLNR